MKKTLLIFILSSTFLLAKQNLKFEIVEKNSDSIRILITKEKKIEKIETNTISRKNDFKMYVVKEGDTLSLISKKFQVSIDYLVKINNLKNRNLISVNQKLVISK